MSTYTSKHARKPKPESIPVVLSRKTLQASMDRDDARAKENVRPCTSVNPARCNACGEWCAADVHGECPRCHRPFVQRPLVGLAKVKA